ADGDKEMGEGGGGIGLAARIDGLDDAPRQAQVGLGRHRRPEAGVREMLHVGGRPAGLGVIVEAGSHAATGSKTTRTRAPAVSTASAKSAAPASTAGLVATSPSATSSTLRPPSGIWAKSSSRRRDPRTCQP